MKNEKTETPLPPASDDDARQKVEQEAEKPCTETQPGTVTGAAGDAASGPAPAPRSPARKEGEASQKVKVTRESVADQSAAQDPVAAERDKLKDQLLRMAADFDNFRKRTRRDLEETRIKGSEDAIRELLPVFDNLSRAIGANEAAKNAESIVEGVRMVLKMFDDIGDRVSLKRIPAIGERFDPAVHDAIQMVDTDQYPPGTVITEVNPGYLFRQRLLRPSIVIVARAPKPAGDAAEPEGDPVGAAEADDIPVVTDSEPTDNGSGEQSS